MKSDREYVDDVRIDVNALDAEWIRQGALYQKYAEEKAAANNKKRELKEELDVLKSRIDVGIRTGSIKIRDDEGKIVEKLSEATISSGVTLNEEVRKKTKEYNFACYEYDVLDGVVESFSHKKKALEKLVDLFIFGFHGEPKVGRVDRIRDLKRNRASEYGEEDED